MNEEKCHIIENRVLYTEYDDILIIKSPTHRSKKYIVSFLICSLIISLLVYCLLNFETVSSKMESYGLILNILAIGTGISLSLHLIPLAPSIVVNSLINNIFLSEKIKISHNLITLKNYGLFETSIPINEIKSFEFKLKKITSEYSGVPFIIPNYRHTLVIHLLKFSKSVKFFKSIKENEIDFIYQTIKRSLIKNGIALHEEKYPERIFLTPERNSES